VCKRCIAKTTIIGKVVPGIILVRATVQGCSMEPNEFGLVKGDDLIHTFMRIPRSHPFYGLSDNEANTRAEADGLAPLMDWSKLSLGFSKRFLVDLNTGWWVVKACLQAGYDPDLDGAAGVWLFHRMGVLFQEWGQKQ